MLPDSDPWGDVDDAIETINVGGACASLRMVQIRSFGLQQIHDLIKRKVTNIANDTTREESEYYKIKKACIEAAESVGWFACLHVFRIVKNPVKGSEEESDLHHSLVLTDETMRCWLVCECDPRIDVGKVAAAREAATDLRALLHRMEFPVSDISFLVFTPICKSLPEDERTRGRLSLSDSVKALKPSQTDLIDFVRNSETAQRSFRLMKRHKAALGCDPPVGSITRNGKTIVPCRQ
eukprot:TRINITY_DN15307_c0_g1_i1.p1 TRINITY_DN15307_c0_g1~~TRINITY_DN15307_c0_g1_i1.p1  ORF type:complete len:237 (+),score=50.08 TRINITY_DN15307_c0_g1_i1:57-767(+)